MRYLLSIISLLSLTTLFAQPKTTFDASLVRPIVLDYLRPIRYKSKGWYFHAKGFIKLAEGLSGATSEQYKTYLKIDKVATQREWKALLNHPYPEIRYYAFKSLVTKGNSKVELIKNEINDRDTIYIQTGCTGWGGTMIELYLRENWHQLNEAEKKVILESCFDNNVGQELLTWIKPTPNLYYLTKYKVSSTSNALPIMFLARYKKASDELLLKEALETIYTNTPKIQLQNTIVLLYRTILFYGAKPSFKPVLEKMMAYYLKNKVVFLHNFFHTYAKYKDKWAAQQLMKVTKIKTKEANEKLYHVMKNYQIAIYKDLFFKLCTFDYSNKIIPYLYKIDKSRTLQWIDTMLNQLILSESNFLDRQKYVFVLLIEYKSIEKGEKWQYDFVKKLINSNRRNLEYLALHFALNPSKKSNLAILLLNKLYTFPPNKNFTYQLAKAINQLNKSTKQEMLHWYEINKEKILKQYPRIKYYMK